MVKKILLFAGLAMAAVMPAAPVKADTYCVKLGLIIMGEPWLAHPVCAACPTPDGDCPPPGDLIPDLPGQDSGVIQIWIDHHD